MAASGHRSAGHAALNWASGETRSNVLSGLPPLQVGEDFHVPIEAGGAASEVLTYGRIYLPWMFGEAC